MKVTVLAGGVGGARFLLGMRAAATGDEVRAIVNVGDDMWLAGLRITPDLDSILYALAGVNDTERGWGRVGESERVSAELAAWSVGWPWFTLGDLDLGTHIARTSWLREGLPLSTVVERLSGRWPLGVRLLPASDDKVETQVIVSDPDAAGGEERSMHFQEWWTRYRAELPALRFELPGVEDAAPAPGVLDAIADADLIVIAPSNPVVSIGTILAIPGIRSALTSARAPVVGVSPIIGGRVVRGMADACLTAIGVQTTAGAVARHYGARREVARDGGGLLDGWLVDDADAGVADELRGAGIETRALPLLMRDDSTRTAIAAAAIELGSAL